MTILDEFMQDYLRALPSSVNSPTLGSVAYDRIHDIIYVHASMNTMKHYGKPIYLKWTFRNTPVKVINSAR